MKSLVQYIKEAAEDTVASSKTLSFNLSGLDGVEDTLKAVQEIADKDEVEIEVEDNKVKVTLKKDSTDKAEGLFELLQDFIQLRGRDQKVSSDQSYAEKIHKLNDILSDWRDYVDDANEEEASQKEADKKEDETEEKKEEE